MEADHQPCLPLLGGALATLVLAACGETPASLPGPESPLTPPPIEAPPEVRAETYEQFDMFRTLAQRVAELEDEIGSDLLSWESYRFEDFLTLDPWDLPPDQVYYLKHFCEGGHILLKERAGVLLLEREIDRRRRESLGFSTDTEAGETSRHRLNARLAKATEELEQRILDLEKVATMTGATTSSESEIEVPPEVSGERLEAARRYVADRQRSLKEERDRLHARTDELEEFLAELDEGP